MTAKPSRDPFVTSLALSSLDVPMEPLIASMGLVAKHLHTRGELIDNPKYPSLKPATQHYASVCNARSADETGVSVWLEHTLRLVAGRPDLVALIGEGRVEAMPWIGVMIHEPVPPLLRFDPSLVALAKRLGARILIEDYNREQSEGHVPQVTWLG